MVNQEKQLAEAIRSGDEAVAEAFYEKYCHKIYRMMYFSSASESDAEELTRMTFLAFFESLPRFRGASKVSTWLYAIAKNTLKTYYQKKKRETPYSFDDAAVAGEINAYLEKTSLSEDTPDILASRAETVQVVRRVLANLKGPYRDVLTLRYVEGLNNRDVACYLGKSESNVRVVIHRATVAFRQELARIETQAGEELVPRARPAAGDRRTP